MKKLLLPVGGVLTVALVMWIAKVPDADSSVDTNLVAEKAANTHRVTSSGNIQLVDNSEKIKDTSFSNRTRLDEYQADKIIQFNASRGYFDESQLVEYFAYDMHTLESLAKNGDVKAIQLLAVERLKQGEVEASFQLWLDAAVYGSTQALNLAASGRFSWYSIAKDPTEKEARLIEAFALIHVSKRRGDHIANDGYLQLMKDIHRVKLTSEQEKKILEKANRLYKELENRRKDFGLGPFDNHVPNELKIPLS